MAVVKSPKNNKRKNLWILKNTAKLKKLTNSPTYTPVHFKTRTKSYNDINFKYTWGGSIGQLGDLYSNED